MANFTKNYETTEIVENPNVLGGGARPLNTYDLDLGLGGIEQIHSPYGGNKPMVKNTEEVVRTGTLPETLVAYSSANLSPEDKFYEMLGIKPSSGGWGIQSRPLGRLLVAVVLVGGYFAYKKFKK